MNLDIEPSNLPPTKSLSGRPIIMSDANTRQARLNWQKPKENKKNSEKNSGPANSEKWRTSAVQIRTDS
jgi:hypothetical protein